VAREVVSRGRRQGVEHRNAFLLGFRNDSGDEPRAKALTSVLRIDRKASEKRVRTVEFEPTATDRGAVHACDDESLGILPDTNIWEVASTQEIEQRRQTGIVSG